MKIFDTNQGCWSQKVNFVDANNVLVGYDTEQECCEHAGWFIADKITPYDYDMETVTENAKDYNIELYSFDPDFFEIVESGHLDEGGQVAFKLVAESKPDLYLHLFNSHNGYYAHGFEIKHSGEVVNNGNL